MSVALAKFRYTNQIDYKIRPAVIVSNGNFNKAHNFVLACPITTKLSLPEFELEIPAEEFFGKLKARSFVRTDALTSMEKELFFQEIGRVKNGFFERIKAEIIKNFQ